MSPMWSNIGSDFLYSAYFGIIFLFQFSFAIFGLGPHRDAILQQAFVDTSMDPDTEDLCRWLVALEQPFCHETSSDIQFECDMARPGLSLRLCCVRACQNTWTWLNLAFGQVCHTLRVETVHDECCAFQALRFGVNHWSVSYWQLTKLSKFILGRTGWQLQISNLCHQGPEHTPWTAGHVGTIYQLVANLLEKISSELSDATCALDAPKWLVKRIRFARIHIYVGQAFHYAREGFQSSRDTSVLLWRQTLGLAVPTGFPNCCPKHGTDMDLLDILTCTEPSLIRQRDLRRMTHSVTYSQN